MKWEILIVDILFLILAISVIHHGYKRGLIGQAVWFFSSLIGFVVASRLAGDVAHMLDYRIVNKPITIGVAFIILFMISIWFLHLVGAWLTKMLNVSAVGLVNKVAGAIFSGLLFLVSVAFVVGLAFMIVPKSEEYLNQTIILKRVLAINKAVLDKAILEKIRQHDSP